MKPEKFRTIRRGEVCLIAGEKNSPEDFCRSDQQQQAAGRQHCDARALHGGLATGNAAPQGKQRERQKSERGKDGREDVEGAAVLKNSEEICAPKRKHDRASEHVASAQLSRDNGGHWFLHSSDFTLALQAIEVILDIRRQSMQSELCHR